ncbi:hypothetical protein CEXT_232971 [Caerostris extrusa]|uniref:Uncharacterized protein n=1 Tax=Caerostris extrusa TaxID=172846 RepID=A0AAV4VK49_CAEEX|nr:hypothetical protein CEXT_232971 [Caerostris extrusa]
MISPNLIKSTDVKKPKTIIKRKLGSPLFECSSLSSGYSEEKLRERKSCKWALLKVLRIINRSGVSHTPFALLKTKRNGFEKPRNRNLTLIRVRSLSLIGVVFYSKR